MCRCLSITKILVWHQITINNQSLVNFQLVEEQPFFIYWCTLKLDAAIMVQHWWFSIAFVHILTMMNVWRCYISDVSPTCVFNLSSANIKKGSHSHKYIMQWDIDFSPTTKRKHAAQLLLEQMYIQPGRIIEYKTVEWEQLDVLRDFRVGSVFIFVMIDSCSRKWMFYAEFILTAVIYLHCIHRQTSYVSADLVHFSTGVAWCW